MIAASIPSVLASLTPSHDAEIRRLIADLHAARSTGGAAAGIAFTAAGRPREGKRAVERRGVTISVQADGALTTTEL